MSKLFRVIASSIVLMGSVLFAQEDAGKGLPALVEGNEAFGRKLLQQEHAISPARNVAFSPLSLTVTFTAMNTYAWAPELREQMQPGAPGSDLFFYPSKHNGCPVPLRSKGRDS